MDYFQHLLTRSIIWVAVIMLAVLANGCNGCLEKERIALLQLKDSINIPNRIDRLPSWEEDDNMDCCHWERVECSSTTRRVIKLELGYTRDWRSEDDYWHLNASILLPFESLRSLNLSENLLRSFVGNEGIGNLGNLEELDLSHNYYLDNSILPFLNKLSNLKLLRLARNYMNDPIYVEGIGILSNLTNLEELDLSWNYLENGILPSLNKLSNLKFLRLAVNNLNGSIFVKGIGILSNLTNLEELDLSGNNLGNGILPSLNKLSNLKFLRLASTHLNGPIFVKGIGILSNLTNLEELELSNNNLGNSILPSLNKLSNLKFLSLAENKLNGSINVKEFEGLNNLKELDLSYNAIASISALNGSQEESGILKKLEVLYLSGNEALNNSVWSFLGGLSSIKTLDLSYNRGLHGANHNKDLRNVSNIETLFMDHVMLDDVLPYIRVMTSIQVLSLTTCDSKRIPSIEGLCQLKKLRELDVAWSGFGETLPWCLANLTSLRLLDLTFNHFTGNIARSPLINLTSLEYLAISYNDFEVSISFKSFFNHSKLVFIESLNNTLLEEEDFPATSPSFQLIGLRLSNSKHGHSAPSFPRFLYHQHDLVQVELYRTDFIGKFPYWLLDNNTRMETLILSYNSFVGPLLLPTRHMRNLLVLDISNNHLEGFLPYQISSSFLNLEFFNMSTNNFEGNIPSSFGDMTALQLLDFSNNRLSGKIPIHLAKGCPFLSFLSFSNNYLTGPVLPHHDLTELRVLYSNNNGFTEIPSSLSRSTKLVLLDVSANQLVGKIPGFIGNYTQLRFLAMAGNHLEGPIPIEFCQLKDLYLLDLSENNITGAVPSCFSSSDIESIRLSKNKLQGPFPMAFRYYTFLMELDLSYNQFSGNIPTWIGSFSWLTFLLLQNNNFEGNIPKELCNVSRLSMIDLSSNNLFGSIPPCISEIEFNGIQSTFVGLGTGAAADSQHIFKLLLQDLRMVLLQSETITFEIDYGMSMASSTSTEPEFVEFATKGMFLSYKGIVLDLFSGINLSHNRLTGPVPPEIGNLSHIKVLNLSHNNFIGTIPVTFSKLKSIESLDLSYNHLHGKIPSQLTVLNFLVVFNLSFNNLSGRMPPRVNQFGTFESSSYIGNPLLCGEPLPRKCNAADSPPSTTRAAVNDTEEDSSLMDMDVFYMSFAGSYVTVVSAIVAILLINPYWRRAWFHLVEVFITFCYYFVVDNLVEHKRGFLWK